MISMNEHLATLYNSRIRKAMILFAIAIMWAIVYQVHQYESNYDTYKSLLNLNTLNNSTNQIIIYDHIRYTCNDSIVTGVVFKLVPVCHLNHKRKKTCTYKSVMQDDYTVGGYKLIANDDITTDHMYAVSDSFQFNSDGQPYYLYGQVNEMSRIRVFTPDCIYDNMSHTLAFAKSKIVDSSNLVIIGLLVVALTLSFSLIWIGWDD